MTEKEPLWISEADVVSLMDLGEAIDAVEGGLLAEARGEAENMQKTVVTWNGGTLHALGGKVGGLVGTKTWAHTEPGATPLLVLYDATDGDLVAIVEARALGQLRTAAITGVATRWLAPESTEMAIFGTGKQSLPQVAAIAAVRSIERVRVYGRNAEGRRRLADRVKKELGIDATPFDDVADAARRVAIITTVTRAREPFLTAAMVEPGAHINAIGAIVPTGAEVAGDLVNRCTLVVADSIPQAQNLSRELIDSFGSRGKWHDVQRLSTIVAERRAGQGARGPGDLTLFKSLGIGIADLAIGAELVRKAHELRVGRRMARPEPAEPRLRRGAKPMARRDFTFVDRTGAPAPKHQPARPVIIRSEDIEAEVERLASLAPPANGRRVSAIVNPIAGVGNGLAPGIAVSLSVLNPGERTRPVRHNASLIEFCIRGGGTSIVDGKHIRFSQYDVWNVPTWSAYGHINDTDDLQVRLTYSNSALLETLNVHVVDEEIAEAPRVLPRAQESASVTSPATFPLTDDGAMLMAYEKLIHPDIVSMAALHWPWNKVKEKLDDLNVLGRSYAGRRLYLLYNPATGRTNGTSHSFFATMCLRPANVVDRPHRHTASAINYFFQGSGSSVIEGNRYEWKAGDLMLTAPGWAIHNHSSHDGDVYELTIQDSPLQIGMGSLLWQEDLSRPPHVLGATGGFTTNRPPPIERGKR